MMNRSIRFSAASVALTSLIGICVGLSACTTVQNMQDNVRLVSGLPVAVTIANNADYSLQRISKGSAFRGVQSMQFDPKGQLVGASLLGQRTIRFDTKTSALTVISQGPATQASDVAIGADGTLALLNPLTGKIQILTAAGETSQTIDTGLSAVTSISFTTQNELIAARAGSATALYKIDASGKSAAQLIMAQTGALFSLVDHPDGLIGGVADRGEITLFNLQDKSQTIIANSLGSLVAINTDRKTGNVYALDGASARLYKIVRTGPKAFKAPLLVATVTSSYSALAIAQDGSIWVANAADGSLTQVSADNGALKAVVPAGIALPGGLAIQTTPAGESLYFVDGFALRQIRTNNLEISDLARSVAQPVQYPSSVSASVNHLLVSSKFNGTVVKIDRTTGAIVSEITGLKLPTGVIELGNADLLIAESGSGSILRVTTQGGAQARSVVVSGLSAPHSIAIAPTGLFVTESGAGVVSRLDPVTGRKSMAMQGLSKPQGIAIAANGRLIIAEVGKQRIISADPATGASFVIMDNLPITANEFTDTSVAVGADQTIYFGSSTEGSLYRIQRQK
jgi:streptogramin lyase